MASVGAHSHRAGASGVTRDARVSLRTNVSQPAICEVDGMAGLLLALRSWIDPGMSNLLTIGSANGHVGIASYGQLTYGRLIRERVLSALCIRAGYRLLMVLVPEALLFLAPPFPADLDDLGPRCTYSSRPDPRSGKWLSGNFRASNVPRADNADGLDQLVGRRSSSFSSEAINRVPHRSAHCTPRDDRRLPVATRAAFGSIEGSLRIR